MSDHSKDHVSALFEIEVCDENGKIVNSVSGVSDSFLTNFILLLRAAMGNAAVAITFGGRSTNDTNGRMYMRITLRNGNRTISRVSCANW